MARLIGTAVVVATFIAGLASTPHSGAQEPPVQPNLLVIMTDDQRADTMSVMPATRAAFDVAFRNYVVTTPNCCPSRSTYLTGRYVHNTRVFGTGPHWHEVFKRLEPNSLGPWLQAQGYHTGFIGKYFNGYGDQDPVPPGWNEFFGRTYSGKQGNGTTMFKLREHYGEIDQIVPYPNPEYPNPYATRVFGDKAQQFLERAPSDKPVALLVWTVAPNTRGPEPTYADAPVPSWNKPPSFMEANIKDKPSEIRKSFQVQRDRQFHREMRSQQLRQLMTVDDMVEQVVSALGPRTDKTWGIFTSDNGRFWGEHRLADKVYAYEESARVPLRMMIPDYPARGFTKLTGNIDIAPTLMDLAGDGSRHNFNGRSLLPLLEGRARSWRKGILIEHLRSTRRYDAVRTNEWLYVHWPNTGHRELYDLRRDPYQMLNIAKQRPGWVRRLHLQMRRLTRA